MKEEDIAPEEQLFGEISSPIRPLSSHFLSLNNNNNFDNIDNSILTNEYFRHKEGTQTPPIQNKAQFSVAEYYYSA